MILIIPIGGLGERFKKNNYKKPKALINLFGKTLITYLLDNLNVSNIDYIYIPYNKEYLKFRFEDFLIKKYPNYNFKFYVLENNTRGCLETLNISLNHLNLTEDSPLLCLDCDNFYSTDIITKWNGENKVFSIIDKQENPIYSYIKLNSDNTIVDIIEKNKISDNACTGAYGFSSVFELLKYSKQVISEEKFVKNEFYMSTVIKEMISQNINFKTEIIENQHWHCLGTPIQVRQFYNNYPKINFLNNNQKIKQLRICFDLDNTLVTYPKIKDDYKSVQPIIENINLLKYLKRFGHTIIIYTARRMKTHNGNTGKLMSDIGKITFDTLDKFEIPYDEIYFGKPYADFYIDDNAINCFDNLDKELGFYLENILPRDFNSLEKSSIELFTKKSENLSGEIYYYKNIPNEIKDMFPLFIDSDDDYKWYKIEKINGLTLTELYLNELLTKQQLIHIMNSIKRFQKINISDNQNINIYDNYLNKLVKRYNTYDYSKYDNNDINTNKIYKYLYINLKKYEENRLGKKVVIHGDPVFTNILINEFGKIKFIDMRGSIDGKLSIYGDWLYDWAKIYQSLIGYDKILQNKLININYENSLLQCFEKYFIQLYSKEDLYNLRLITKSLLFTLIPLHDNDNCSKYLNLIRKIYDENNL